MLAAALAFGYVALNALAMITDYRRMLIPNAVVAGLVALFAVRVATVGALPLAAHGGLALGVLAVGAGLFARRWMAAGDVKLAAALSLWMGPALGGSFLLLVAVLGGIFAVLILAVTRAVAVAPGIARVPGAARLARWGSKRLCPYGIPIGLAGIMLAPALFPEL